MHTQTLKLSIIGFFICLSGVFIACTGGRVETDLTVFHPAHPQAAEAAYRPPINPFQGGPSGMSGYDETGEEPAAQTGHPGKTVGDHGKNAMAPGTEKNAAGPSGMDHSKQPHGGHGQ